MRRRLIGLVGMLLAGGCASDTTTQPAACQSGTIGCAGNVVQNCVGGQLEEGDDCSLTFTTCIPDFGCSACAPDATFCCTDLNSTTFSCDADMDVLKCSADGKDATVESTCNADDAQTCFQGDMEATCQNACEVAAKNRSYVGCDYYAVDMDNYAGGEGNAAAQKFAFVLSNPSALTAHVVVEINNALPGQPVQPQVIRTYEVAPNQLVQVDDLDPLTEDREVDGSPPGTYDQGTDTALTSNAIHITSTAPLIVYQFNPFERFDVFSNDASLLVPTGAVGSAEGSTVEGSSYQVMGWPQLLADTDDPETDAMIDLPALLTIIGTADGTTVTVQTTASTIGSPDVPATAAGGVLQKVLGPFDVLNLESAGFGQDFSGTTVNSTKPVLVFSGNECTDVPSYSSRFTRQCCCDHMEEQLFPLQTFGKSFVAVQSPLRTKAIHDAGGDLTPLPAEKEYWRLLTTEEFVTCTTTLPDPLNEISLVSGSPRTIEAQEDFLINCSAYVVAAQFVSSQVAVVGANNNRQPAGDPAFMVLPPTEQYRTEYLFLTPDKYAFDYIMVAAPSAARVWLDDAPIEDFPRCERTNIHDASMTLEVDYDAIRCELSKPEIDPTRLPPSDIMDGDQNDGVHSLRSDQPVSLMVYGFDRFVSYGYPGGSNLAAINLQ